MAMLYWELMEGSCLVLKVASGSEPRLDRGQNRFRDLVKNTIGSSRINLVFLFCLLFTNLCGKRLFGVQAPSPLVHYLLNSSFYWSDSIDAGRSEGYVGISLINKSEGLTQKSRTLNWEPHLPAYKIIRSLEC